MRNNIFTSSWDARILQGGGKKGVVRRKGGVNIIFFELIDYIHNNNITLVIHINNTTLK